MLLPDKATVINLPTRSTMFIARVLFNISKPALIPWIRDGTLSSPCDGAPAARLWLTVSLTRARLMMHSRITDSVTR